jgi:polyisoprenoid-binding protein YceI
MAAMQAAASNKTMWQIDSVHSNVEFAVRHLMIATVRGRFSDVTGTVTVAGDDFSPGRHVNAAQRVRRRARAVHLTVI